MGESDPGGQCLLREEEDFPVDEVDDGEGLSHPHLDLIESHWNLEGDLVRTDFSRPA